MTNWFKNWWNSVREWIGVANTKIDEVQGDVVEGYEGAKEWTETRYSEVEEKVDSAVAKANETVDKVQEEIKEAKSMLDKATQEDS